MPIGLQSAKRTNATFSIRTNWLKALRSLDVSNLDVNADFAHSRLTFYTRPLVFQCVANHNRVLGQLGPSATENESKVFHASQMFYSVTHQSARFSEELDESLDFGAGNGSQGTV